jgi:endonuclease YncB( thermonuclease family)
VRLVLAVLAAAVGLALGAGLLAACASSDSSGADADDRETAETVAEGETSATAGRSAKRHVVVKRVLDGDTIVLRNGRRVRLVQIDAPEFGEGECYSRKAAAELRRLLPPGTKVRLVADPSLDKVDRYGRLLRYVHRGSTNINLQLVKGGAASVWFFEGDRGRYARKLLRAAEDAKVAGRGLWGACPGTTLDPLRAVATVRPAPPEPEPETEPPPMTETRDCDPAYPTLCLDPNVSDYDCAGGRGNGPEYVHETDFPVKEPDPFGLDGNEDRVGCES